MSEEVVTRPVLPPVWWRWVALWRRNVLVWRKLLGPSLLANFGEPFLYLLALGYGLGGLVGEVEGLPYLVFLASGIVCSSAMITASFEGMYSAYTRMAVQQTWDAVITTPLSLTDVVIGEIAWAATKSLMSASCILLVAALLGVVQSWQALWALPVALLTGFCFGAMAMVVTAISRSYDFFLYYQTLVVTPMFLLSGIFFPLREMPQLVQSLAQLVPLTHAVAVVRPLITGQTPQNVVVHLMVLLGFIVVASWLAIVLVRRRMAG